MIRENLSTLKIHKLTQEQYDRELEAGRIDPNALYLTPDEDNSGIYIQNEEPTDAEDGALWVDLDEDGSNSSGGTAKCDIFIINISINDDVYSADKTGAEIVDAYESGRQMICQYDRTIYYFCKISHPNFYFSTTIDSNDCYNILKIEIDYATTPHSITDITYERNKLNVIKEDNYPIVVFTDIEGEDTYSNTYAVASSMSYDDILEYMINGISVYAKYNSTLMQLECIVDGLIIFGVTIVQQSEDEIITVSISIQMYPDGTSYANTSFASMPVVHPTKLPNPEPLTINGTTYDGSTAIDMELAKKTQGIFYIVGDSTTAGTWTGTSSDIEKYYDGLTVLYKTNVAGISSGTTLNINNLGAASVKRNASTAITTIYPVGSVIMFTYSIADGIGCWLTADYDANTKTTAGTSNRTDTKLLLVGATSQTSGGSTTYSNTNCYIGTDNRLYSAGVVVPNIDEITALIQEQLGVIENGSY